MTNLYFPHIIWNLINIEIIIAVINCVGFVCDTVVTLVTSLPPSWNVTINICLHYIISSYFMHVQFFNCCSVYWNNQILKNRLQTCSSYCHYGSGHGILLDMFIYVTKTLVLKVIFHSVSFELWQSNYFYMSMYTIQHWLFRSPCSDFLFFLISYSLQKYRHATMYTNWTSSIPIVISYLNNLLVLFLFCVKQLGHIHIYSQWLIIWI